MNKNQVIIKYRRATADDNFIQMARILYGCDPYIYPYWRDDEVEFAQFLEPWINVDGFVFNHHNFYLAHQDGYTYPLAVMVAVTNRTAHNFDYDILRERDPRTAFIVDHYLQRIVNTIQSLPDKEAYGVALSVDPALRGQGIGSGLFRKCVSALKKQGIEILHLDCLKDNTPARNMYDKLGFEVTGDGIGFDGTDHSTVEIVSYSGRI